MSFAMGLRYVCAVSKFRASIRSSSGGRPVAPRISSRSRSTGGAQQMRAWHGSQDSCACCAIQLAKDIEFVILEKNRLAYLPLAFLIEAKYWRSKPSARKIPRP
jgi:hypothetical protein